MNLVNIQDKEIMLQGRKREEQNRIASDYLLLLPNSKWGKQQSLLITLGGRRNQ